jgi:hypothetical protein
VLTIEVFLPSEQRSKQGAAETRLLLQRRSHHLVDGSHSPMSVMLSLLSYAKFVSLCTPGSIAGSMWWSLDRQTFFIKGHPVELARFRTIAQSVVVEAEQVLWEQLLVNGLQALYSSYLTQMLFTVEMKGKREGGCHLMLFVFAHGLLIVEARWVTAAEAR